LATEFIGGSPRPVGPRDDSSLLETARTEPRLVVTKGARRGAEVMLRSDALTIGRGEEADLQIDEPAASRRHAVIERRRGAFVLRDLGSTNGTYLRGLLHGTETALRDGDHFRIGETEIVFRDAGSV
jgi:pSer/pThr/pTyr-binding forkhead associated (FHA) protein